MLGLSNPLEIRAEPFRRSSTRGRPRWQRKGSEKSAATGATRRRAAAAARAARAAAGGAAAILRGLHVGSAASDGDDDEPMLSTPPRASVHRTGGAAGMRSSDEDGAAALRGLRAAAPLALMRRAPSRGELSAPPQPSPFAPEYRVQMAVLKSPHMSIQLMVLRGARLQRLLLHSPFQRHLQMV